MSLIDVSRLSRLTQDVLAADGSPRFILLPARRLISRLLLFFAVGTLLLTLSYTLLAIVTIPVLVFWGYLYVLYCHIWDRFCLSRVYTVGAPILAVVLSVALRIAIYSL